VLLKYDEEDAKSIYRRIGKEESESVVTRYFFSSVGSFYGLIINCEIQINIVTGIGIEIDSMISTEDVERAAQQYTEMPEASSSFVGKIIQFIGITDSNYTNGYFYKCVENDGVYSWQNVNVQAGGGGTSDFDLMNNRPSYNGTAMTHSTNIPEVPSISEYTAAEVDAAWEAVV